MRNFMKILGAGLMALLWSMASAFAFSHGAPATGKFDYVKNEITYHAPFVAGLAIHGEHIMWRVATPSVLDAATELGIDVSGLATRVAELDGLPTAAFTNDTLSEHINLVHPVHDEIANLVRELNATEAGSAAVLSLNATLLVLRDMHRDDAVCAYVAEAAILNNSNASGIDYNSTANADLWQTVEARVTPVVPPVFLSNWMLGFLIATFTGAALMLQARYPVRSTLYAGDMA